MSGEFDGGDDFDVALGGVGYDVGDFASGVVAAVGGFFTGCWRRCAAPGVCVAVDAPGAYVVECGVVFGFDAPALVVAEVPDEFVEFVGGEEVEVAFDFFGGDEVAADVEEVAAEGVAGSVEDGAFGECDAAVGGVGDVGGEHLDECLEGVKESRLAVGADEDAVGNHLEEVAFVAQFGVEGVVEGEEYAVFLRCSDEGGSDVHFAQGGGDVFGGGGVAAEVFEAEPCGGGEGVAASFLHEVFGLGYDVVFGDFGFFAT